MEATHWASGSLRTFDPKKAFPAHKKNKHRLQEVPEQLSQRGILDVNGGGWPKGESGDVRGGGVFQGGGRKGVAKKEGFPSLWMHHLRNPAMMSPWCMILSIPSICGCSFSSPVGLQGLKTWNGVLHTQLRVVIMGGCCDVTCKYYLH